MRRNSFAQTACLLLGVAVGSVGLSACRGGGGPSPKMVVAPPGSEMMITPPGNRAPQAVGSIPAQTVKEAENRQTGVQEPENGQTGVQEPENSLTGLRVQLQGTKARETSMRMTLEPADASWSGIKFEIDPHDAGWMCCYQSFAESVYFKFTCSDSYTGNATIMIFVAQPNGPTVDESVAFTCR